MSQPRRILLVSAPYVSEYMRNARCDFVSLSASQWYPILLGYCGAYLEGKGHTIKFIDAPAHDLSHEAARNTILDFRPDLLVLYSGHMSEDNDLEFAEPIIERLGCDSVIVGPYASINPEATLAKTNVIKNLVSGEFERAVQELAEGVKIAEIQNLVFKQGATITRNPPRPCLTGKELDDIPFVSRFFKKHVDLFRYKTPSELHPFVDIMTGRGCAWGRCTYCLWVHTFVKGQTYNVRSMKNVIEELKYIEAEMPEVRSVMIQDDTFTDERALEFSRDKVAAGIRLPWSCYARANMKYDTLKAMKESNCRNLHVGYESGDQETLNRIKKGLTIEQMTNFTRDVKKAGLRIHGDFAFGFPGETPARAKKTIAWAYELNPHTAQFQLLIPFPGTPVHEEMKNRGWLNKDGQPDMPQFPNAEIRAIAKQAYRRFYLSPKHLWKFLCHPHDIFFGRLRTIRRALPAMFWSRWKV